MTGYRCQNQCGGHPLSKLSINNLIRRLIIWGYSPPSNLSSEMKKRRKSHLTSWGGGLNWEIGIDIYTLLLNHFSHVRFCATPHTAAHQAPPFLGFSRQEHWSGLPFPSPRHEGEKWKWSRSVVSNSSRPHGLQPTRLLRPLEFPGKSTGVGCHCLLQTYIHYYM